ncbi:MAG: biopolymer transporter ExbD [Elusimicrobia bacterium]|nr:biopolymer transporter ExbD [Elusimicrobiota bacterium]
MAVSSSTDDEPITDINLTPLVDVSLVLVIIFMAVAPMAIQAGIKVLESRAKTMEGKSSVSENVTVTLRESGELLVNGKATEFEKLFEALQTALLAAKDKMVVISADEKNRVGQVVEVLDLARQAGAVKLAIVKNETVPAKT